MTAHVRGTILKESFERAGWRVEFLEATDTPPDDIVRLASGTSLVYLLKVASATLVQRLRQETNARIVFDLTDALWKLNFRGGWKRLEDILLSVDAVFSENEYICGYGRKYNQNVFSLPACTQVERFDALRSVARRPDGGRIRLGWVGSAGTVSALRHIIGPLKHLSAKHPELEVRVVGADEAQAARILSGIPHTAVAAYDEESMIREILAFDVGLFPMPGDPCDYCVRGALKAMLYMTGGKPPIAQRLGEPARVIEDGVTGMLAGSTAEWELKLATLIDSVELRHQMGARALESIRHQHSVAHVFAETERAMLEVLAQPATGRRPVFTANPAKMLWHWLAGFRYNFEVRRKAGIQ